MAGAKMTWNESALKELERQVREQTASLEGEINRIAGDGAGKPVEDLVGELMMVIQQAGVTPNIETVRTLAEGISAGEPTEDLIG